MKNQKCRICGCTELNACHGGCYWAESNLCSNCVLVDSAKKDLYLFLGYELGDYSYFEFDQNFEIEDSDEESVQLYVKFSEDGVKDVRFRMDRKDFNAEDTDFEDGLDVSDRWKVSVEICEDNWEEINIFNSSIKYLYIALLLK